MADSLIFEYGTDGAHGHPELSPNIRTSNARYSRSHTYAMYDSVTMHTLVRKSDTTLNGMLCTSDPYSVFELKKTTRIVLFATPTQILDKMSRVHEPMPPCLAQPM